MLQITNYDVLIEWSDDDTFHLIDGNHVGNKRFEVFLNLHQDAYSKAKAQGRSEDCDRIVDTLVEIVCHKCVPNGRFLEHIKNPIDGEDVWLNLGEGHMASLRVHQALSMRDRSVKLIFHGASPEATTIDDQDAALKRRRRGSYARLRRSISESILNTGFVEPSCTQQVSSDNRIIQECNGMDVIFGPDSSALSSRTQNIGSARFQIMIDTTTARYKASSSPDQRLLIVRDLIQVVHDHWKGRFLVEYQNDYQILDSANAEWAVAQSLGETLPLRCSVPDEAPSSSTFVYPITSGFRRVSKGIAALRNAAVNSLRARKQKKEITNRMGMGAKLHSESNLMKKGDGP